MWQSGFDTRHQMSPNARDLVLLLVLQDARGPLRPRADCHGQRLSMYACTDTGTREGSIQSRESLSSVSLGFSLTSPCTVSATAVDLV